jgi:rhodanese-related sulfurtransferase
MGRFFFYATKKEGKMKKRVFNKRGEEKMKKAVLLAISAFIALSISLAAHSFADVISKTPVDAYNMATSDPDVYIVDVRTEEEWRWIGHPGRNKIGEGAALEGKVVNVSFKIVKHGVGIINPSFLSDMDDLFEDNPNVVLITICRSGSRGRAAARVLVEAGYDAFFTENGFEGASDARGYRTINGWLNDGLPYSYSWGGYYPD